MPYRDMTSEEYNQEMHDYYASYLEDVVEFNLEK
tara:strand:- start:631 stop:732 length:102 start_codon:yes stop_codon:yes gene_type:complete